MINKVMLVGKVKSTPQARGSATSFRMGTWKIISDGRRFDTTHSVEGFGRNGELISTLREGELVSVEGAIKHSSYEKNGQKVWFTAIVASSVSRVGEAEQPEQQQQSPNQAQPAQSNAPAQAQQGQTPSSYPPATAKPQGNNPNAGYDEKYGF
tara:strand:+ start:1810 stop:2268 length:459 start_codon:yes stop_codon:yes gene_type:complete